MRQPAVTAALVAAAGRGERLGAGVAKALLPLGGVPMLVHAVRALATADSIDLVVVAAPPGQVEEVRKLLEPLAATTELQVVPGGSSRGESVRAALAALPDQVCTVLVHDAARPLAPSGLVDAVAAAVRAGADGAIPAIPLTDTVKRVENGVVVDTVDRSLLWSVQTPQGFSRSVLERAHRDAALDGVTDDATLVERLGARVVVVPGSDDAFKVTRPLDVVLAETVLARRTAGDG